MAKRTIVEPSDTGRQSAVRQIQHVALLKYAVVDRSGGTRQFLELAAALVRRGVGVTTCSFYYDEKAAFPELARTWEHRFVTKPGPRVTRETSKPAKLLHYVFGTGRLAQLVPPDADVLNPHEWLAHRAAIDARRGRPVVWMVNDPNRWDMARTGRTKNSRVARLADEIVGRFDDRVIRGVTRILVLDRRMQEIVETSKRVRAYVVRSGLDPARFSQVRDRAEARASLGLPASDFVVLSVGILFPHRRFEDLITAASIIDRRELTVVIVGRHDRSPGYGAELRKLISRLDLGKVVRLVKQSITDDELLSYYAAADVFVFPNVEQTWGLAAAEAMASGLPVVATPGSGIHEVIEVGRTGLVVPARRPEALAGALNELRASADWRAAIGKAARSYALSSLSWDRYATQLLEHFEAVLG